MSRKKRDKSKRPSSGGNERSEAARHIIRPRRKLPHEWQLSRRTMLRGALGGATVALALPTLEAMLNG